MKLFLRILKWMAISLGISLIALFIGLRILLDRTREFRAQAKLGQPIVHAIEQHKQELGSYPGSLAELTPKYLDKMPDIPDRGNFKFQGWEYRIITNQTSKTYTVRYYMGRGGVEYEPPCWYGNDEGHRKVILRNRKANK